MPNLHVFLYFRSDVSTSRCVLEKVNFENSFHPVEREIRSKNQFYFVDVIRSLLCDGDFRVKREQLPTADDFNNVCYDVVFRLFY